jgi:hypothetical protein
MKGVILPLGKAHRYADRMSVFSSLGTSACAHVDEISAFRAESDQVRVCSKSPMPLILADAL